MDNSQKKTTANHHFQTTHWSLVMRAGHESSEAAAAALERLCRISWYPVYAFVRREGKDEDEAKDLTQAFFEHLLSTDLLAKADANRGRFRTFLIRSLRNFLTSEWRKGQRLKRGGDREVVSLDMEDAEGRYVHEPTHSESPDQLFERRWAKDLLRRVMTRLREEYVRTDNRERFDVLKTCLAGDRMPAAELGEKLGLSEAAARRAVFRLRKQYQNLFRAEVANLVLEPGEVEVEMRHIIESLRGKGSRGIV